MFGWENDTERTRSLAHALTHPLPAGRISSDEAPCQEEVLTDDLDVNKYIMAIRHTPLETELTIGRGNSVVVGEYFHGGSHIGYNRMNFRWGNVGTFQVGARRRTCGRSESLQRALQQDGRRTPADGSP